MSAKLSMTAQELNTTSLQKENVIGACWYRHRKEGGGSGPYLFVLYDMHGYLHRRIIEVAESI